AEDGDLEEQDEREDDLLRGDVEVCARLRRPAGTGGREGGPARKRGRAHAAPPAAVAGACGVASSVAAAGRLRNSTSEPTANRMIAPCAAFSQSGGRPRKLSVGRIIESSATPISVPTSVPRPPVT